QPKGVMIDHRGALNTIVDINQRCQVNQHDKLLALSNLNFDLSVYDVFGAFNAGATLVIPDASLERDPNHWIELIARHQVSIWNSVPALMGMLLESIEDDVLVDGGQIPENHPLQIVSLRWVLMSGDWIPLDLPTHIKAVNSTVNIYSLGGATEASIWSIGHVIKQIQSEWNSIPYGQPLSNQSFHILDDQLQQKPMWVAGNLYIGGIGLALGYWKDQQKTNNSFIIHPETNQRLYKTGDLGRYLADGEIEFLGREDFQVKIQGYRIELGEIESALLAHKSVLNCVVSVFEEASSAYLVGYIVSKNNEAIEVQLLKDFLANKLPHYMIPQMMMFLEVLPLTANGKINRKALPRPDYSQRLQQTEIVMPSNQQELWLHQYWKKMFELDVISVQQPFFELGGDSLMATRLVAAIRKEHNIHVPLAEFFNQYNTIESLASFINLQSEEIQSEDSIKLIQQPDHRYDEFLLDEIQQAYWLGRHGFFELGNTACHFYLEMDCVELDLNRFEQAWNLLIKRHDMLRAVILPDGHQQKVLPHVPYYEIDCTDISPLGSSQLSEKLSITRDRMSDQMHSTDRWPLFEIKAHQIKFNKIRLHFSFDLLVADVWSFLVFSKEWKHCYETPEIPLPKLNLTFRDYCLTETQFRQSEQWAKDWQYWQNRLSSLPPGPELPLAKAPASIDQPKFIRFDHFLNHEAWTKLKENAKNIGFTPSMIFCAAFSDVLARWSKRQHFTLNLTLFNRLPVHSQVDDIIGDFTSLELLEINHNNEQTFAERIRQIQQQLLQDLEHRVVNGVTIQRELSKIQGGALGGAVLPVVFTSALPIQETDQQEKFPLSWLGEKVFAITQTPQVWLDHQIFEDGDGLSLSWDVVDELFPTGLMSAMFNAYVDLIHQIINDAHVWQKTDSSILPFDQIKQHQQLNQTQTEKPIELLHEGFFKQAKKLPDHIAIVHQKQQITYQQAATYANQLATDLQQNNDQGKNVAIVMKKGWQQSIACLGVLQAGCVYVPIDPSIPAQRLEFLLKHIDCCAIITQPELVELFDDTITTKLIVADQFYFETQKNNVQPVAVQSEDLAYIIFTSGSTGLPKGVMINHVGAVNTIVDINKKYQVTEKDRIIAISNLNFDLSVYDVFGCFNAGATLVVPDAELEREPAHWQALIVEHQVSIWNTVPALMKMLVEHIGDENVDQIDSLRLVMMSGDWIALDLPQQIWNINAKTQVISLGGATEVSIWSIDYPIHSIDPDWNSIPYGKPLANQQFYVLNSLMQECPNWVVGDLYIGGDGLALGYWKDQEKTEQQFIFHPKTSQKLYKTGDLGRYLPNGLIEFSGRDDFQVKIQGYRIELGEIEAVLLQLEAITNCVVTVVTENASKHLVAYVITQSDIGNDEISALLGQQLPHYMVPQLIIPVATIPLTANGKIDRNALPKPDRTLLLKQRSYQAPSNEAESWLCQCFAELLDQPKWGVLDHFFELGGDSLTATRAVSQIRKHFKVELALATFFENPVIENIAKQLENAESRSDSNEISLPQITHDEKSRHQPFALNDIQQAYWMGRQEGFELGSVACHFYLEIENDELDVSKLQWAWQQLVKRHDMLRAVVNKNGVQQVLQEVDDYTFIIDDLTQSSSQQIEQTLIATRNTLEAQVFDTTQWPLFEIKVNKLPTTQRLHLSFDLLVADVWSFLILFKEWQQLYDDSETQLPVCDITFRDYIVAEQQLNSQQYFADDWKYWNDRLHDIPGGPELPLAVAPSSIKKPHFVRYQSKLNQADWQRLKQKARNIGLTPSMILCAVYARIMDQWSKTDRFTLNITQFHRLNLHEQVNEIVGDFTSLTLLVIDTQAWVSFSEWAKNLQQQMLQDMEHRNISGIELMKEISRQQSTNIFMPVVFTSAL
ncbi:MAG: amino acid adenylation domain-containing protein, partial [Methylococcales bacterium]|nr:amino acid adenylation domain-containing protein [Methylococcales bacterium]